MHVISCIKCEYTWLSVSQFISSKHISFRISFLRLVLVITSIVNRNILPSVKFNRIKQRWNCVADCKISSSRLHLIVCLIKTVPIINSMQNSGFNMPTIVIDQGNFKIVISSCGDYNVLSIK